jgi:hypothetical protein
MGGCWCATPNVACCVSPLAEVAGCPHWRQVRELLRGPHNSDAWRLQAKRNQIPNSYLAGIGVAITATILPYGEELLRCLTADQQDRAHSNTATA